MDSQELIAYRLKQLEEAVREAREQRTDIRNVLGEIQRDLAVQKTKLAFYGAAAGAVSAAPITLIVTLLSAL